MTTPDKESADSRVRQVEMLISNLLRGGVILSMTIVVIGTVVSFTHNPEYLSQPPTLERVAGLTVDFPHTLADVMSGLRNFRGKAIVMFGLLVLIATPVFRVGVSIVGFAHERDRRYVVITSVVLCLLLLSFFLGKAEH